MAIDLKLPISKVHWIMVVNIIHYVSMKNYVKHIYSSICSRKDLELLKKF